MTDRERAAVAFSRFFTPRRRPLIALVAVPAILIGLLAMHFLAGPDEVASSSMGMSASAASTTMSAMTDVAGTDCAAVCLTSHEMTMSMTCVLAQLVTVIILTLLLTFSRRDFELLNRLLSLWRARIASLPPPLPPSLHVLSISRI